jgi:IS4 transposase
LVFHTPIQLRSGGPLQFILDRHVPDLGATTIAAIYKQRWQIELFFKAIKQNLKIKTFVGTSANAVRIQIWTALIAIVLMKLLQFRSRLKWALSNLVALLR